MSQNLLCDFTRRKMARKWGKVGVGGGGVEREREKELAVLGVCVKMCVWLYV